MIELLLSSLLLLGGTQPLPELVFGGDSDADYEIWSSQDTHISADGQGRIYIADPGENRVLCFDNNGKYHKTLVRQGQGPGEYESMMQFQVLNDGSFVGIDRAQAMIYRDHHNANGSWRTTAENNIFLEWAQIANDGKYMAAFWVEMDLEARKRLFKVGILDKDLKPVKVHSLEKASMVDPAQLQSPSYWEGVLTEMFERTEAMGVSHASRDGVFYFGGKHDYRIKRMTADGKVREWRHTYQPQVRSQNDLDALAERVTERIRSHPRLGKVISNQVVERALAKADLPPMKPSIFAITTTEKGLVIVVDRIDHVTRNTHATIFDPKGKMVGELSLPDYGLAFVMGGLAVPRIHVKGNKAYTILTDGDGENRAARYAWKF